MKTLRDVKIGETATVVKLHGEGAVKRRIMDMGITKRTPVYVRKVAPLGAIRREMNSARWTWFAICYQCGFAYVIALMINQFGNLFTGNLATGAGLAVNIIGLAAAVALLGLMIYMLFFKKYKEATKLTQKVNV